MKNYMISEEEILREKFNSQIFDYQSLEEFFAIYHMLLQFACMQGTISEMRMKEIEQIIILTILKVVDNSKILASNILYVFSAWLRSMTPYDAYKNLENVNDEKSAIECINFSDNWLKSQIMHMQSKLQMSQKYVFELDNEKLKNVYSSISKKISLLSNYRNNENIILKDEYGEAFVFLSSIGYDFIKDIKSKEYIAQLNELINSFLIEMRIFEKLNGKYFLSYIKNEAVQVEKKGEEELANISEFYNKELDQLEKNFEKAKKKAMKLEREYDRLSYNEQLNIDSEILNQMDIILITRNYENQKLKLKKEWDIIEKETEKRLNSNAELLTTFDLQTTEPSLIYLIKECALILLVKKGEFEYPENATERTTKLDIIPTKTAIEEVLQISDDIGLTDGEINYLRESCE